MANYRKPTTKDEFTPEAIILKTIRLEKGQKYRDSKGKEKVKTGAHVIYSGLSGIFKEYFPAINLRELTEAMEADGKIAIRPVRGGVMLYLPEDAPAMRENKADALAERLGLHK